MRFAFIAAKKAEHRVTILCRCMRVTRSGFYAWTRRGLSARAQRDVVLRTRLRAFHAASAHRYGRPRLWKDLKEDGEAVSEKRVKRLMREEQIQGKVSTRFKHTTNSDHDDPIAANVLDRDFTAAGPNQRWVGDTTEFVGSVPSSSTCGFTPRPMKRGIVAAAWQRGRPPLWCCEPVVKLDRELVPHRILCPRADRPTVGTGARFVDCRIASSAPRRTGGVEWT